MTSIAVERDLVVPMRDGARLLANLFRPTAGGSHPVIKLWVSTSEGDDLDLFVVLPKLDPVGRAVFFSHTIFTGGQYDSCVTVPLSSP